MNANQIIRRPLVTEKSTIQREEGNVISFEVDGKALLIDTLENTNAVLASRNNPKLNFVDALHVNVYDVVNSRYIVLSQAALDRLTEALSNER